MMKKKYMIPETEEVRLLPQGELLIASLTDGEVGSPELFDDIPQQPELPVVPTIPGIPDFPVVPNLGPDIPGL